jgi:mRNA interferase MazF
MKKKIIQRGDIWYADLPTISGSSIQGGRRPVLVYQTDTLNGKSPTVNVLAITSQIKRKDLGYHVELPWIAGLTKKSMVLAEQAFTLDQNRLFNFRCRLSETTMKHVERARRMVTRSTRGHKQSRHRRKKTRYSCNSLKKKATVKT